MVIVMVYGIIALWHYWFIISRLAAADWQQQTGSSRLAAADWQQQTGV